MTHRQIDRCINYKATILQALYQGWEVETEKKSPHSQEMTIFWRKKLANTYTHGYTI